jgi:hypothetical protein
MSRQSSINTDEKGKKGEMPLGKRHEIYFPLEYNPDAEGNPGELRERSSGRLRRNLGRSLMV